VTAGAQPIEQMGALAVAQAPLWGLARTITHEHPELACKSFDLSGAPSDVELLLLADELRTDAPETQVALRREKRYVARLVPFMPGETGTPWQQPGGHPDCAPAGDRPFRLETAEAGVLEHVVLRVAKRRPPGPGEVEIEVRAAGLNFLDVLAALGVRPDQPEGIIQLGGECAGVVSALGEDVKGLQIGDEVIALAAHSFGKFVLTPSYYAIPKPAQLSFEEAATIPIAFMTAYYALHTQGRLIQGERVLIHSAAGGVGLAAIQVARDAGAEIFATVGNEEKREFLRSIGIQHVMDSRSLTFADEILDRTGGQGVDVVLNSLAGEAIEKSLAILALHGRFLEIGKRDIYQNNRIGLGPFRKNLAYFAIDLARMFTERPAVCAALLRDVVRFVADGRFQPLPRQVFPISDAVSAFRLMAQGKHIGKIVLSVYGEDPLVAPAIVQAGALRPDGTYVIAGGLGGLGLATAQWMVDRGARHLALLGRTAPSEMAQQAVEALEGAGAQIATVQADLADAVQLADALGGIEQTMPPLCGIVHAAGVLDDGMVLQLTPERFQTVMASKVRGAWNLHRLSAGRDLDCFVMFSSASALIGSPGQGNYAAANAFLDALAHARRALGLPALSINWGPWAEAGLAARPDRGGRLSLRGISSITPAQGVEAFGRLLQQDEVQVGVMALNVRQCAQFYPALAGSPLFSELMQASYRQDGEQQRGGTFRLALLTAEPGRRRSLLETHLREQAAHVLGLSPSRIDKHSPLGSLGFDSLMTLDLRNRLETSLGLSLSATLVWNYPTITDLTDHLAERLGITLASPAGLPTPLENDSYPSHALAEIQQLSDAEAEAALAAKLSAIEEGKKR
ncbi:MAG TPA: SDR family NAD(P)-dependent oxidoreductase, partial [Chloroflexaceae bacterium]|nr:SDR family NAD(P)-dependent oxidoreductase [Chloroflexaceae bacterium]